MKVNLTSQENVHAHAKPLNVRKEGDDTFLADLISLLNQEAGLTPPQLINNETQSSPTNTGESCINTIMPGMCLTEKPHDILVKPDIPVEPESSLKPEIFIDANTTVKPESSLKSDISIPDISINDNFIEDGISKLEQKVTSSTEYIRTAVGEGNELKLFTNKQVQVKIKIKDAQRSEHAEIPESEHAEILESDKKLDACVKSPCRVCDIVIKPDDSSQENKLNFEKISVKDPLILNQIAIKPASETATSNEQSRHSSEQRTEKQGHSLASFLIKDSGDSFIDGIPEEKQQAFLEIDGNKLGRLRVHLSLENDNLKATFVVENTEAREFIEKDLSKLRESLLQEGIKAESMNIWDSSSYENRREEHSQHRTPYFIQPDEEDESLPEEIVAVNTAIKRHFGEIDYFC